MTTATPAYPLIREDSPQHMRALHHANVVRLGRAVALRQLRHAERDPLDVLRDPALATMPVHDVLLNIAHTRRVLELPPEKRRRSYRGRSTLLARRMLNQLRMGDRATCATLSDARAATLAQMIRDHYDSLRSRPS